MTAFNAVRMRVKPGREKDFLDLHRNLEASTRERMLKNGLRQFSVVKTGDRNYCVIGEWENFDGIVKSRDEMIKNLDQMRDMLEDLGGGLGVTDPISGETVVEIRAGK